MGESTARMLYESETSRVSRLRGDASAPARIRKDYLGPRAAERCRLEQEVLARLAAVEGVVQPSRDQPGPVTTWLEDRGGCTLADILAQRQPGIDEVLSLAAQLARTLAEVHRRGVVHRDVNPANIVVDANGQALLIDFDLAMAADRADPPRDGPVVGTLAFVAPEQTGRTGHTIDARSDLYSFGATLYAMAAGRPLFESQDRLVLIHDHLVREPEPPSAIDARVPADLDAIVMRLLAKSPAARYQSAEGLLHDLRLAQARRARGDTGPFAPGERDFPLQLAPPPLLLDREAEFEALQAAFGQSRLACRIVLVEGEPGVGKSTLVQALRPVVASAEGWFVSGKFGLPSQDTASSDGLVEAMRALARLLLAEPREALDAHRARVAEALGGSASLVTRALPEFRLLLGEQPEPGELDPLQAQARLVQGTLDSLGAIASPSRPLVLFLDDLQWAGPIALRVIERLLAGGGPAGLLVAGAWRSGDVDAEGPLTALLRAAQQAPEAPVRIELRNLSAAGLRALVARMLRLTPQAAAPLAEAVGSLSAGNPFHSVELVNALRREGLLGMTAAGWEWDTDAVRRFVGRGNVTDLLAFRVARLPDVTRQLLQSMACLGLPAPSGLIAAATGLGDGEVADHLGAAAADGLLVAGETAPDSWRFRHDRVERAVLESIDGAERGQLHLALARRLARAPGHERRAAQQYFECVALLTDPAERLDAARRLHDDATRLMRMSDFPMAERYLREASRLFARTPGAADALLDSSLQLHHSALYSLGLLAEADAVFESLRARLGSPLDLVMPACRQMRSLDLRSRPQDAIGLGLQLLVELGMQVPDGFEDDTVEARLDALREWAERPGPIAEPARDARVLAAARVLARMLRSAFIAQDTKAMVWLVLESHRLWTRHGPCADLVASLGRANVVLARVRQDYRTGYEAVRRVLEAGEAFQYEPQTSEALAVFATYSSPWFDTLETAHAHACRAYEGMRASGDDSYLCYIRRMLVVNLLDIAPTIAGCLAEVETGLALCERTGNTHAAALYACEHRLLLALAGSTPEPDRFDGDGFDESAFLAREGLMHSVALTFHARRAFLALIMGRTDDLRTHADLTRSLLGNEPMAVDVHLFAAMARAWQLQASPSAAGPALLREFDASLGWLGERAADQPYNFLHLVKLLQAERAWATGDAWEAARAFDAAAQEASGRARPWHRALVLERGALPARARTAAGRRALPTRRVRGLRRMGRAREDRAHADRTSVPCSGA